MRTIEIMPYNSLWPKLFEKEKELILRSIPTTFVAIHHIGSTSIKGLAAKPVIDILIEVNDIEVLDKLFGDFEAIGYECKGEFGIPGRRYFQKGGEQRTHQIHAFKSGSYGALRHLAFRDYLRENNKIAKEYEALKYQAAKTCSNNIDKYCELKKDFILHHERLAMNPQHQSKL